jgi:hypothetical protein
VKEDSVSSDLASRVNVALSVFHNTIGNAYEPGYGFRNMEPAVMGALNAAAETIRNYITGELFGEDDDGFSECGDRVGRMVGDDMRERGVMSHPDSVVSLGFAVPPAKCAFRYVVDVYNGELPDDE